MTIKERIQSPTPRFYKKLRNISLVLAGISATILTSPAALPAVVIKLATYLGVGASVASVVSQTVTEDDKTTADGK